MIENDIVSSEAYILEPIRKIYIFKFIYFFDENKFIKDGICSF